MQRGRGVAATESGEETVASSLLTAEQQVWDANVLESSGILGCR